MSDPLLFLTISVTLIMVESIIRPFLIKLRFVTCPISSKETCGRLNKTFDLSDQLYYIGLKMQLRHHSVF